MRKVGPTLTRTASVNVKLAKADGTALAERTLDGATLANGSYVVSSVFAGQTIEAGQKLVLTAGASVEVTCLEGPGKRHVALGVSDVKLRF